MIPMCIVSISVIIRKGKEANVKAKFHMIVKHKHPHTGFLPTIPNTT